MWDGHLEKIEEMEDWIELSEDSTPSFQQLYYAGPTQRLLEQEEIEKMLKLDDKEPVMGRPNRSIIEEMRTTTILRWLSSSKRRYGTRKIPHKKNGRMNRFNNHRQCIFNPRLQLWLLENAH